MGSDGHKDALNLMRNRYETSALNYISVKDSIQYDVDSSLAISIVTAFAALWMLLLVCVHAMLLNEILQEVGKVIEELCDIAKTTRYTDRSALTITYSHLRLNTWVVLRC